MENKFLVPIGVLAFLKVRILYMVQYTIYIVYMYIYIIMVIKEVNSDHSLPRCQPRLCFWASYSTSPCLGSLLCKRKIISLLIVRLDKPMCVKWIKWYPKHDPWLAIIITLIYILNFYYLFTFGCTGPLLLFAQAFASWDQQGLLFLATCRLLIAVVSLAVSTGCRSTRAQ